MPAASSRLQIGEAPARDVARLDGREASKSRAWRVFVSTLGGHFFGQGCNMRRGPDQRSPRASVRGRPQLKIVGEKVVGLEALVELRDRPSALPRVERAAPTACRYVARPRCVGDRKTRSDTRAARRRSCRCTPSSLKAKASASARRIAASSRLSRPRPAPAGVALDLAVAHVHRKPRRPAAGLLAVPRRPASASSRSLRSGCAAP